MRTLKSFTLAIPAILLACGTAGGPEGAAGTDARQLLQRQLAGAQITLEQAIDIAVAAHPGSVALEADLEGDDDEVLFEVELLLEGDVLEVEIDALTGEIVAVEVEDAEEEEDDEELDEDAEEEEEEEEEEAGGDDEDEDDVLIDCAGSISAEEAAAIAEAATSATAVEVEVDDDCEIEVTLEGADGFIEVELAPDGTVLEIEADEDDADEDDADEEEEEEEEDADEDAIVDEPAAAAEAAAQAAEAAAEPQP